MEQKIMQVEMADGRIANFSPKRKMAKSFAIEDGKVRCRIDFDNGRTLYWTVPDSMLLQAAGHGALQKLGDSAAGVKDTADCFEAVDDMIHSLDKGDWIIKRVSGDGMAGASILVRALMELTGKTREEIKAFLSDKSQADKRALRENTKLKPIVLRLEAEKNAKAAAEGKGIDTDALLAALDE